MNLATDIPALQLAAQPVIGSMEVPNVTITELTAYNQTWAYGYWAIEEWVVQLETSWGSPLQAPRMADTASVLQGDQHHVPALRRPEPTSGGGCTWG